MCVCVSARFISVCAVYEFVDLSATQFWISERIQHACTDSKALLGLQL